MLLLKWMVGFIGLAALISAGIALNTAKPPPNPIAAAPVVDKQPRMIPLYHKIIERAPMDEPVVTVTTVEKTPRKNAQRVADGNPLTMPIADPPGDTRDVCARHGLHKVVRGKSWHCR